MDDLPEITIFAAHGLIGARCVVLGPADSMRYVEQAGGRVVAPDEPFEALVIGDESGFPSLPAALRPTYYLRALWRGWGCAAFAYAILTVYNRPGDHAGRAGIDACVRREGQ